MHDVVVGLGALGHWRVDEAWCERVDAYSAWRVIRRGTFRYSDDRGLRGSIAVRCKIVSRGRKAEHRRHVQNHSGTRLTQPVSNGRTIGIEHRVKVGAQRVLPTLIGNLVQRPVAKTATASS